MKPKNTDSPGYPEYSQLHLPSMEKDIQLFWEHNKIFEKSVTSRSEDKRFIFYEGPPSANGKPGIHHVMGRTIKDLFCRFKTLQGYRVERKAGWDTHGLPIELNVEKELGITKKDIGTKISVAEYNKHCRADVLKYTDIWQDLTAKMGYWVDMEHPYVTCDDTYIESLWALLKILYEKGLLYKGFTIQPYSPAAGTGLSAAELNQPGCYRDVKDITAVAMFKVVRDNESSFLFDDDNEDLRILAWTTTPWTLPSNVALAVGSNITYLKIRINNPYTGEPQSVILAEELFNNLFFKLKESWLLKDFLELNETEVKLGDTNYRADGILRTKDADYVIEEKAKTVTQEVIEQVRKYLDISGLSKAIIIAGDVSKLQPSENVLCFSTKDILYGQTGIEEIDKHSAKKVRVFKGSSLVGLKYEQLFPFSQPKGDAFRVIAGDFVTTTDGTGVVHISPVHGADDMRVAKQNGIVTDFLLVNEQGRFTDGVGEFSGEFVKEGYLSEEEKAMEAQKQRRDTYLNVDIRLVDKLKKDNKLFKSEKYEHTYPHCWRTDKPVIYYPLDSWFIKTTAIKDRLIELNKTINWKPAYTGEGRFGQWLENLVDWNLSRSRYWGTPLPIWRTRDGKEEKCIGSIEELKKEVEKAIAAGIKTPDGKEQNTDLADLHKPHVDEMVLLSDSGQPMYREADLIDVWFDSGAMPYAQWHWPMENDGVFKANFPADFIAEGVDQTRGWFFTLHVLGVALFDSVAYKNVVSNGLLLDKNGVKMSKRLGNIVEPFETIEKYSADATRWYMIRNSDPWDNLKFDLKGIEEVTRAHFGTLYNTYGFFALYANIDGFKVDRAQLVPMAERTELDRWIISKLQSLVKEVTGYYEDYEPTRAARAIEAFVDAHLSNWYVRLSRRRFWKGEMGRDKQAAYETLHECLYVVAQLMSPVSPFFSDWLYRNVTGDHQIESVHLTLLAKADESLVDKDLEERMELAQRFTSLILSLRKKVLIKVRQPLSKVLIPVLDLKMKAQLEKVESYILSEVNVKEIQYVTDTAGIVKKKAKPNFKSLGKKAGAKMKLVQEAIVAFTQDDIARFETDKAYRLTLDGQSFDLTAEDVEIISEDIPGWLVANDGPLTVALDVNITDDLRNEGVAREFVNKVQNIRKDKDFQVLDRIRVSVVREPSLEAALAQYHDYIANEILANKIELVETLADYDEIEFNDSTLKVSVQLN